MWFIISNRVSKQISRTRCGFKATPGSGDLFAHTVANDEPHKLNAAFNLNRFISGDLVDEHGAAAVAH